MIKNNSNFQITHGFTRQGQRPRFYRIWESILRRCRNPKQNIYKYYGGRGIKVIWNSFEEFKEDMYDIYLEHCLEFGIKNTTIDRIDSNGNYSKENCRWQTSKQQSRNTRRNKILTFKGEVHCCAEWAEIIGMHQDTLWMRLKRGWSIEKSLTTPLLHA